MAASPSPWSQRARHAASVMGFAGSVGVVVTCLVLVRAEATGAPPKIALASSELDAAIATRTRLLGIVRGQMQGLRCGGAEDTERVAGCRELAERASDFERQIADLRSRAGGRWADKEGDARLIRTGAILDFIFGPGRGGPRDRFQQQSGDAFGGGRFQTTMCVRLCDGYYWPMSYAAGQDRIESDSARCQTSCRSPAKLYRYSVPGGSPASMVDLNGKAYADLPNAFRHKVEYVKDCRCTPDPWSAQAKAEYNARAVLQADLGPVAAGDEAGMEPQTLADAGSDDAEPPAAMPSGRQRPRLEPPPGRRRRDGGPGLLGRLFSSGR